MATKTTKQLPFYRNPVEAIRDAGSDIVKGVGDSLKHQLLEQSVTDLWSTLLKGETTSKEDKTQLAQGQEVDIFTRESEVRIEGAIDYAGEILHAEERTQKHENRQLRAQIEEIKLELVKISKSSKQLETAFRDVNTAPLPTNPGKYHVNFFEWVLATLRAARVRIEESETWLKAIAGKSKKKGYWNSAKQHGTSFSLSSERTVATQVG